MTNETGSGVMETGRSESDAPTPPVPPPSQPAAGATSQAAAAAPPPSPVECGSADASPPAKKRRMRATARERSMSAMLLARQRGSWVRNRLKEAPGWLTSFAVHLVIFLVLAMIALPAQEREQIFSSLIAQDEPIKAVEPLEELSVTPDKLENLEVESNPEDNASQLVADQASPVDVNINDLDLATNFESKDALGPNIKLDKDLGGRSAAARAALVKSSGGSEASERAVNSGMKWLAEHQQKDGSWTFNHGPDNPGTLTECTMGATGLALLAYLGAGQTHKQGDYTTEVRKGLNYLVSHMKINDDGGDLRGKVVSNEGMYVQGICTIAVCEAYALTKDRELRQPAQLAINFILSAQDPKGGGWRYTPQQPGDTSVVGWQIMALESGKAAKLVVPSKHFNKATHFLDSVESADGAQYGYDKPGNGPATTAVGLLCRMYMGWTPKRPALRAGVEYLSKVGPQPNNMYYNYYATQVLHQWGDEPWVKWNSVMRDHLVKTQITDGEAAGSWNPDGGHSAAGGRLYTTCMSIMTLEVYYRHLPIYHRQNTRVKF